LVQASGESFAVWLAGGEVENEWVGNYTVTGLEGNAWLESIWIYCTDHLERNVWAVEETSVIWRFTLISGNEEVETGWAIWIDVDADLTTQDTSKGALCVINV
jgi:hypothetical protein